MVGTSSADGHKFAIIGWYLLLLSVTIPAAAALVVAIVAVIESVDVAILLD